MSRNEDGVNLAAEDKQPTTSGLQEDIHEDQKVEKNDKRASRRQVSAEDYWAQLVWFLGGDCCD